MPDLDLLRPRQMYVGDSAPDLPLVVRDDETDEPLSLTGWTTVGATIRFREVKTQEVVIGAGTITIDDADNGEVRYTFDAADTAVAGVYDVLLRMDATGAGNFLTLQWTRQLEVRALPAPTP